MVDFVDQLEPIRKPLVRQFNVHVGECRCCQRQVQGRYPLQTSDALAAAAQLGPDATNHQAEQALRPAVVNRKVWGGNRTCWGARVQSILMSVLRSC